jgi:hypothetical protein
MFNRCDYDPREKSTKITVTKNAQDTTYHAMAPADRATTRACKQTKKTAAALLERDDEFQRTSRAGKGFLSEEQRKLLAIRAGKIYKSEAVENIDPWNKKDEETAEAYLERCKRMIG